MAEWNKESIQVLLATNEKALLRAIVKIFENQTTDEQISETTHHDNGIGFTGCDAHILSSFAKQIQKRGFLSPKQMVIAKRKMPKYWKQIQKLIKEKQSQGATE